MVRLKAVIVFYAVIALLTVFILLIIRIKKKNKRVEETEYTLDMELLKGSEGEQSDQVYSIGNAQNIGFREEQQDSFWISDIYNYAQTEQKGVFAVLADGMGGLENGKESSKMVVSTILNDFFTGEIENDIPGALRGMVDHANAVVNELSERDGIKIMTGSTVVAVLIKQSMFYWISVGDSRIYLFTEGRVEQLTRDHILGNRLDEDLKNGIISLEEAWNNPSRAALTSFIGIPELIEVDQNSEPLLLKPGDRVVLCSDGIYGSIDEQEIADVLKGCPQSAVEQMIERVISKQKVYQDNMTVIVLGYM